MSAPKYKDWILETIDQLRKRKARPDLERICHMVERKHGVTFEETEADLERLVDSEIVIKVDYKGSTSYRNAMKWRKSHLGGHILNSNDASRKIQSAMLSLTAKEQESGADDKKGASLRDIEKWIQSESADTNLSKNHLQVALDREIDAGRLEKLPTGNFIIHNSSNKTMKNKSAHNGSAPAKIGSPSKKGRPATKRKRFKKSHGPDFESFELVKPSRGKEQANPKREETPPPPLELEDDTDEDKKCDYCLLTAASNRNGDPEELLVCKDCQAKAHPSCMQYSEELAKRARNSPWQCIDCKTCYVCDDSGDPDAMLFCDACDKGYHMNCHNPPIQEKPTGKWVCSKCILELGLKVEEEEEMETDQPVVATGKKELQQEDPKEPASAESGGPSCLPTPSDSPIQFQNGQEEMPNKCLVAKMNGDLPSGSSSASTGPGPTITASKPKRRKFNLDGEIPDASDWSIDDVEHFFEEVGFPEQAYVFREQEIDGKSLLLMKRSDVLTGLSLKLGPALKIYNHVQRLQTGGQPVH